MMVRDGHLGGYVAGGDPGTWSPHVWTWMQSRLGMRSVLDLGSGEGHATRYFAGLGCDAHGVDGSFSAVANSVIKGAVSCHDLCAGPFDPGRTFDIVWSCEFLEHIDDRYLANVLRTLQLADKYLVLTHAFPGQKGHHHVNCQPSSYWISLIEKLGFRCELGLTRAARRVARRDYFGVNHFARSGLVFSRRLSRGQVDCQWLDGDDPAAFGRKPTFRANSLGMLLLGNFKLAKIRHKLAKRLHARAA